MQVADKKRKFKNIEEYIQTFSEDVQLILERIRKTIFKIVSSASETISYNIPAFKLNRKIVVYFAAWKNHISLYPISVSLEASLPELLKYKRSGKGTVQFPLNQPIPLELIAKIVEYRIKEGLNS